MFMIKEEMKTLATEKHLEDWIKWGKNIESLSEDLAALLGVLEYDENADEALGEVEVAEGVFCCLCQFLP